MTFLNPKDPIYLMSRIAIAPNGCWNWKLATNKGYGVMGHPFKKRLKMFVHRFSYELFVGPIPEGLVIDHLCRNRRCANPAHLEPVSQKVNDLRGFSFFAVNARKTHCKRGHEYVEGSYAISKRQERRCRACNVLNAREWRLKNPKSREQKDKDNARTRELWHARNSQ